MLKRPETRRPDPDENPAPLIEFDVIDVTRVRMMLDNGVPLEIDLMKGDIYEEGSAFVHLVQGERELKIATHRILYIDKSPGKATRSRTPITPGQLVEMQK